MNPSRVEAAPAHALLITGVPGVGKTTVLRRVAEALAGRRLGGFYTEEIRRHGVRQGFRLRSFDGSERIMAHVDFPKSNRVGKYGVDAAAIAAAAQALLAPQPDTEIYLVDEIGKMECLSPEFVTAMRRLLDSGKIVVASVALKGEGFIREVKQRRDVSLWEVTRANRDRLPEEILGRLRTQGVANRAGR